MKKLDILQREIVNCRSCTRLVEHCTHIAEVKRRAYRDWKYWGKPVPSFGDPNARLLLIGLAPGAHGANRTGRMFTGDSSGDFLYRALHDAGFANQPTSRSIDDGLKLTDCYIAASVRCAPPDNKPSVEEVVACRPFLERELKLMSRVKVIVALGRLAFDNYLTVLRDQGVIRSRSAFQFSHGCEYEIAPGYPVLIGSYHPSQQNTSTGKLTREMFQNIFDRARVIIDDDE